MCCMLDSWRNAFDQNDLEESILSEMETRLHTRAVFALPSPQQEAAASVLTRSPETRSAKRARTQREPSPAPAADEPKLQAAADAQQSASPGIAEPTGESSAKQKPAPESSENPAAAGGRRSAPPPPAAAVQPRKRTAPLPPTRQQQQPLLPKYPRRNLQRLAVSTPR